MGCQNWVEGIESQLSLHSSFLRDNALSANALREEAEVLRLLNLTKQSAERGRNPDDDIDDYMINKANEDNHVG